MCEGRHHFAGVGKMVKKRAAPKGSWRKVVVLKRDLDLLRNILLRIEDTDVSKKLTYRSFSDLCDDDEMILLHIELLMDAGFILAVDESASNEPDYTIARITFAGYEYLDTVRDESHWKDVKEKLLPLGGSATIDIVKELGVNFLRQQLGL